MTTDSRSGATALLLLDFQIDFLADDGRMPVARNHVTPVMHATHAAINRARRNAHPIIKIGNEFRPNQRLMNTLRRHAAIAGAPGTDWDPRFEAGNADYLPKWKPDAFCNSDLDRLLAEQQVTRIEVAGLQARACVAATTKSALARGLEVHLLTDAIACRSDASRAAALRRLERHGAQLTCAGTVRSQASTDVPAPGHLTSESRDDAS